MADLAYDHVQIFADSMRPLEYYKRLEAACNELAASPDLSCWPDVARTHGVEDCSGKEYQSNQRDIVAQLIVALEWRIVAYVDSGETHSALVRSAPETGASFLVTAPSDTGAEVPGTPHYLSKTSYDRYRKAHGGKPGVGVLAFHCPDPAAIRDSYRAAHPALVDAFSEDVGGGQACFDAFYFYGAEDAAAADDGTVLRFHGRGRDGPVPGLGGIAATYPDGAVPAYSDHWVSNVSDRKLTLKTLKDTLGLVPKVEFDAGVVAAGEAVIESTVAGATPPFDGDPLADTRQIFLPINNPLSPQGHVAGYIRELGQGIQHIATRVPDLIALVERANCLREATGEGVAFLRVPRAYYGRISGPGQLASAAGVSASDAAAALAALRAAGVVDAGGVVDVDADKDAATALVAAAVPALAPALARAVAEAALAARYRALASLLGGVFTEEQYVAIVRNRILVDVQQDDVLLQLFTRPILQNEANDEAPFLEFIQRVCSTKHAPRAGCGGFGVRNFLVLFLSIELNNAASELANAPDDAARAVANNKIDCLSRQLDASAPVLSDIADAAAEEADALEANTAPLVETARAKKAAAQEKLKAISAAHADEMRTIRQQQA